MFALEITFANNAAPPETVFIRRPLAIIGADDTAHVVVDDMRALRYHLQIAREIERSIRVRPIAVDESVQVPTFLEGVYRGEVLIDVGPVKMRVTALDSDLLLREAEASDRAGLRVLRDACAAKSPRFPALVVNSEPKTVLSFSPDQPVYVGRSRQCSLRLDVPSVSSRHAKIGFESGEFWVEDLGSTNGTFINQQQISGRARVPSGTVMFLGRDVALEGVVTAEQLARVTAGTGSVADAPAVAKDRYPILVSLSESARPARIMLNPGTTVTLGRDPSSDMWLGAPHISRRHCVVEVTKAGVVRVTDQSTNGTAYDKGILHRDETAESADRPLVLDFGGRVTVALCFSGEHEQAFVAQGGSPLTFVPQSNDFGGQGRSSRRTTTWLRELPPAGSGDIVSAVERGSTKRGLFRGLSGRGRLAIVLVGVGVGAILVVVTALLVSGLRL